MITRVQVKGYKSLVDVSIELKPLTVIFGPNAVGKSNLFDVLGLLSRMVTERSLRDAFKEHRGLPIEAFHFGVDGLEGMLRQDVAGFTVEVDVSLSDGVIESVQQRIRQMQEGTGNDDGGGRDKRKVIESLLRYSLTVEITPESGFLRVADERLVALNRDGSEKKSRVPFIERMEGKLRLRLEGQSRPTDHDLGLNYTLVSQPLYPPHYPHITAFKEELSHWNFYYLEPDAMRREVPPGEVFNLRRDGANLAAFFKTLQTYNSRQFDALKRSLDMLLPGMGDLRLETLPEGLLQLRINEEGTSFPARLISEGTLRILGLLAITNPMASSTVVGYEEPENGVHPRRLKMIAELLSNAASERMQILVNTHSPILPEYFEDESLVICRRRGRHTEFQPFTSMGPLMRRQDIEDAFEETPLSERIIRGDFDA